MEINGQHEKGMERTTQQSAARGLCQEEPGPQKKERVGYRQLTCALMWRKKPRVSGEHRQKTFKLHGARSRKPAKAHVTKMKVKATGY